MISDWSDASHSFVSSIATILPMFLVLAYMYTVCQTIKGLVLEKELRLKEVLRVVGVRNGALWFSWFTENIALLMVPCALISIMLKVSVSADGSQSIKRRIPIKPNHLPINDSVKELINQHCPQSMDVSYKNGAML